MQHRRHLPSSPRAAVASRATDGHRVAWTLAVAAVLVVLLLSLLMPASASAVTFDEEELEFLQIINDYRASNGRGKLMLSSQLSLSAERHAQDMGKYRYFSHDTQGSSFYPSGTEYWERLQKDGYDGAHTSGENLAAGPSGARDVFNLWKNSSGHNANMLDPSLSGRRVVFREIGIARVYVPDSPYGWYWVTDFGGSLDSTAHDPFADLGGPFKDVPPDHVFADYIEALKAKELVGGYADGRFGLNDPILRGQFAKTIVNVVGKHTPEDEWANHTCFPDVDKTGEYPHDFVEEAAHAGIVSGRANGSFGPYLEITRGQLALMVVRAGGDMLASGGIDPGFSDTTGLSAEFKAAIATAKANGIISGFQDNTFRPYAPATRGQMAKMVALLDQKLQ